MDDAQSIEGALAGVRILDFTRVLSGPFATMVLADLGADVVKVERPGDGDETRTVVRYEGRDESDEDYFYVANRNKRSVTLDLKNPQGLEVGVRLAERADVLVENFSVGVMERLGLGADVLLERNPGLVYCSISGFGQVGPYRTHRSYDSIIQALGGVMSITGDRDGPPARAGVMIGDLAGALYAVIGVLAAMRERERTGLGQHIDVPLLDSLVSLLTVNAAEYLATGHVPQPSGSENPNRSPARAFRAADGRYVQVIAATPHLWEAFCGALGVKALVDDERFATHQSRLENRIELAEIIQGRFAEEPADTWVELLEGARVPCGLVKDLAEVFADPHVQHAGLLRTVEHPVSGPIHQIASPLRFSRSPIGIEQPPPLLGEHTNQVLSDWLGAAPIDVQNYVAAGAFG